MIRLHFILLMALGQAVFADRLVIDLPTGGRGKVQLLNLMDPWLTLALVVIPFWPDLKRALKTRAFLAGWMPFLAFTVFLPVLGVAFNAYPVRTLYSCWNAMLLPMFLCIGLAGALRARGAGKVVERYFLVGVLAHCGMALVQTLGQFERLPGLLRPIYEWDFRFKLMHIPHNIILGRATGMYLNPNALGIWSLLAFWISFFLLKGRARVIGCVAASLTVLMCQSRGTLAALLGSGAIYGFVWMVHRANREDRLKATLGLVAAVVPLMIIAIPGLMDSVLGGMKDLPVVGTALDRYFSGARVLSQGAAADANFRGRTEYWQTAYEYLLQHPFGTLGPSELYIKVPSDNQYVAVLEQGSVFFFGAFVMLCYAGVRLINHAQAHARLLAVATLGLMINGVSAVPFAYSASLSYWAVVGVYLAWRVDPPEGLEPQEEAP